MNADSTDDRYGSGGADPGATPSETAPDEPVADAVRLWGSEHPKLSGAAWRRSQRLERIAPTPPQDDAAAHLGATAQPEDTAAIARAIEALRTDTERRLTELDEALRELAGTVQQAATGTGGGLLERLSEVEREIGEQTARLGRALTNQTEHLNRALSWQAEAVEGAAGDASEDAPAELGRISAQIVGLTRAVADIRASMPAADDLGALLQSEIRGVRSDLLKLRDGGELDRLQAVEARLGELAAAVTGLSARMQDLPPADAFAEILRAEMDRSRAESARSDDDLRALVEDLRARADRIETDVSDLGTRYDAARTEPDRLLSALLSHSDATRDELLRAAEITDAQARTILASIAREVLTLADSQRDLRDEVRRLAARIVRRPGV
jgi:hypothetical protein